MTKAQLDLLQRVANGEPLHWVHPATPTGAALFEDDTRPRIADRTVSVCLRNGWLKVQMTREYFSPITLTEKGQAALYREALRFPACTSDGPARDMLQEP